MFIWIWVISIIATVYIADQKKLGVVGYFFLSLFLGPLAVMIALLVSGSKTHPVSNSQEVNNLEEAKKQLQAIQYTLYAQEEKIKNLESLINKLSSTPAEAPVQKEIKPERVVERPIAMPKLEVPEASSIPLKKSDMELDFGRNWLSKIGVAVLALGMAFLISYTFKYFGPFLKIAFGYLVAGALFFAGVKLEAKDKLMNFGRALLGGAWAIIYFTTYAMYHFEASRIIFSQGVDLLLLSFVVLGMIAHTLRYKSEGMMAVTLFVAYLTTTIGQITGFTIISNLLLAVLILFLVYKFQWIKILSLGIVMTYGIHIIWVSSNLHYQDSMNLLFLTTYWLVFFIGVHFKKSVNENAHVRALAATNFGNIALYSVLAYPLVLKLFYDQRFTIVLAGGLIYLAAALIMKHLKQERMYISDIVAAVFVITFSISLRFFPSTTLLLWFIEIPFLLFIGTSFKEKVFSYFSYALSVFVVLRLMFLGVFGGMSDVSFLGFNWTWLGFICFWASISMAGSFYLTQNLKKEGEFKDIDLVFDHIFSYAACLYCSIWIWSFVHQPWAAFSLAMEGVVFLMIGVLLGLKRFRVYAYLALVSSASVFLSDHIYASSEFLKWFIVGCEVLSFFVVYRVIKYFKGQRPNELFFENEEALTFTMGALLLVFTIFQYTASQWISLSLGVASVLLIVIGFMSESKTERMGGMAVLALTLGRVVLVDLSGLDIIFKIITLIVLGVLFLGVSYIYNRFSIKK